ncbi:MAG: hypothetical protein AB1941_16520 [Gemmatimonadota bacterium]
MTPYRLNPNQERDHLLHFLQTLPNAPSAIPCIGGKPDLVVPHQGRLIGIEHTRIALSSPRNGIIPLEQESLEEQIVREAWELHRQRGGAPRLVYIYFSDIRLQKSDVRPIADLIQTTVARVPLAPGESRLIEAWKVNRQQPGALHQAIESFWIDEVDSEENSLWAVPRGGAVPQLTRGFIEARIAAKEKKVAAYRNACDSIWLLCAADGFSPATHFKIPDSMPNETFATEFDRLFYFHHFSGDCLELKVQPHKLSQS